MTAPLHRTGVRLGDGRQLFYYDRRPGRVPRADSRRLTPGAGVSELRHDRLVDEWVIVAGHRQERTFMPAGDDCPLCPSSPASATEIPDFDYEVAVFENRFPALSAPTGGRCEVVCFTPDHHSSFAGLPPDRAAAVLGAWTDRTAELSAVPGVEQVFVFENRGAEIGVTLGHPHGQIYAYPFVPPRQARLIAVSERHLRCPGCAAIEEEESAGARMVAGGGYWVAFVPFAARWPFDVHIYPRRHLPDLTALDDGERDEFPLLYLDVLRRFDAVFGTEMPYVAAWHQAPVRGARASTHLRLEVFSVRRAPDRLKYLAGSESAMGVFINDIAPEAAAAMLREAR